ncbi:glycosyltransferase family 4 protein [Candidatus Falkowbacteria bacterium]|nr:glycosyltransferase family 4 protein [Candidatus Falkowbacteria bacterium]
MKKLLIATIEFPPQKGGIANYLAGLAGALPVDKVVVLCPKNPSPSLPFKKGESYKVYRKNLISRMLFIWPRWLPMVWHLWRTARREKVEAILVGQVLPVGTAAMILNKFLRLPYFVSCHGMDILTAAGDPRKKKLLNKILEQAAHVVANSEFTKNELLKLAVPENKIAVVYPYPNEVSGIALEKILEIKNRLGLADKKIILTVSRLMERKGHDKVIEAMPKILEKVPNAIYVIVGGGPEKEKLQVLSSKLQVENNILFTGEISEEKKTAFYQLCDVFVMTPRQIGPDVEGFGTVYLEANQYGKPVVAGRSGGVAEAVIDGVTGLIVDPEDVNQITETVIKILSDESLAKKMGEQGRERVEKEFRWEVRVEKLKKILN